MLPANTTRLYNRICVLFPPLHRQAAVAAFARKAGIPSAAASNEKETLSASFANDGRAEGSHTRLGTKGSGFQARRADAPPVASDERSYDPKFNATSRRASSFSFGAPPPLPTSRVGNTSSVHMKQKTQQTVTQQRAVQQRAAQQREQNQQQQGRREKPGRAVKTGGNSSAHSRTRSTVTSKKESVHAEEEEGVGVFPGTPTSHPSCAGVSSTMPVTVSHAVRASASTIDSGSKAAVKAVAASEASALLPSAFYSDGDREGSTTTGMNTIRALPGGQYPTTRAPSRSKHPAQTTCVMQVEATATVIAPTQAKTTERHTTVCTPVHGGGAAMGGAAKVAHRAMRASASETTSPDVRQLTPNTWFFQSKKTAMNVPIEDTHSGKQEVQRNVDTLASTANKATASAAPNEAKPKPHVQRAKKGQGPRPPAVAHPAVMLRSTEPEKKSASVGSHLSKGGRRECVTESPKEPVRQRTYGAPTGSPHVTFGEIVTVIIPQVLPGGSPSPAAARRVKGGMRVRARQRQRPAPVAVPTTPPARGASLPDESLSHAGTPVRGEGSEGAGSICPESMSPMDAAFRTPREFGTPRESFSSVSRTLDESESIVRSLATELSTGKSANGKVQLNEHRGTDGCGTSTHFALASTATGGVGQDGMPFHPDAFALAGTGKSPLDILPRDVLKDLLYCYWSRSTPGIEADTHVETVAGSAHSLIPALQPHRTSAAATVSIPTVTRPVAKKVTARAPPPPPGPHRSTASSTTRRAKKPVVATATREAVARGRHRSHQEAAVAKSLQQPVGMAVKKTTSMSTAGEAVYSSTGLNDTAKSAFSAKPVGGRSTHVASMSGTRVARDGIDVSRGCRGVESQTAPPQQASPHQRRVPPAMRQPPHAAAPAVPTTTAAPAATGGETSVPKWARTEVGLLSRTDPKTALLFSQCRHNRREQVAQTLRAEKLPVDVRDGYDNTALMVACQNGLRKMAKLFVRMGADVNAINNRGNTALHYCFAYEYRELGEFLISCGADDCIINRAGLTCYDGLM